MSANTFPVGELHPQYRAHASPSYVALDRLGRDLQNAFNASAAKDPPTYEKATCLLVSWTGMYQSNAVGARLDLEMFGKTMKEHFGYEVETHLIKDDETTLTASAALEDKCIQVRPRGKNDLLVVYYVGHGYTKGSDNQYYFV